MTEEEIKLNAEATIMQFYGGVMPEYYPLNEVVRLMMKFATEITEEVIKSKFTTTTISDTPFKMTEKDKVKNILNRLLGAVVSTRNTEETMFWITLKRDAEQLLKECV